MTAFNKEKQIEYWKITSISDMEQAEIVIQNGKFLHGLFCWHLTLEKALKAHFVKVNSTFASKTHDLAYLERMGCLNMDAAQSSFIAIISQYQLEGRYPEHYLSVPSRDEADELLSQTKRMFKWLMEKL